MTLRSIRYFEGYGRDGGGLELCAIIHHDSGWHVVPLGSLCRWLIDHARKA